MKNEIFSAFLTDDFPSEADGRVHSVFKRTVNVELAVGGEKRLLTLISEHFPKLPDSIAIGDESFEGIAEGMSARLENGVLRVGDLRFPYRRDASFTGRISPAAGKIIPALAKEFLSATEGLTSGLDRLPPDYKKRVNDALLSADFSRFIGLGAGLTPSFDDACIGFTAVTSALGLPNGIDVSDTTDTTDISLRYLKLARRGYFGEPLCAVIDALTGAGDLHASLELLKSVGASSGLDMIFGIRAALKKEVM